ncbi:DUF302 domain-containing protein [Geothermobacter hydrogeniphilus]|uniref:DUF302 domain-containing protein n=1 Tax=Geothermobacter hydrogeniphilus TaxID=1969733 RepID=A0A1X0YE75_9BACT|nr:DUF302 domain-containing protein [Geothermobacter hydrogeniphilus]ORJ63419.1 hypothetical protein B5V00_00710 [Geothermobacter hydrogeniphilus]
MKIILFMSILLLTTSSLLYAAGGLITVTSAHSVSQTADRLEAALHAKGMTVFNRIDHAAGAAKVGLQLRPTTLVIFGNPKIGSKLMQCDQQTAIDLPMKALIYKDADGRVQLSYNDPAWLGKRHQLDACQPVLNKISKALSNFAHAATKP